VDNKQENPDKSAEPIRDKVVIDQNSAKEHSTKEVYTEGLRPVHSCKEVSYPVKREYKIPVIISGNQRTLYRNDEDTENHFSDSVYKKPERLHRNATKSNIDRFTSSCSQENTEERTHEKGFCAAPKIRTNRFYVGDISNEVTVEEIKEYLDNRDIKYSIVRLMRSRRKNSIAARVNIFPEYCASVQHRFFWPRGVVCRPWMSNRLFYTDSGNPSGDE